MEVKTVIAQNDIMSSAVESMVVDDKIADKPVDREKVDYIES